MVYRIPQSIKQRLAIVDNNIKFNGNLKVQGLNFVTGVRERFMGTHLCTHGLQALRAILI
jgi:hypothetical protein